MTIFLAGDVMTGRGVDQILPHPSAPHLHEPFVDDAREYVRLAEDVTGTLARSVGSTYIWGDALALWEQVAPAARLVNLETSLTRSDDYDVSKGIHYRMHPENIACISAAGFDVCALANNHVLDYGRAGLVETLQTLEGAGIMTVGAGRNIEEARRPRVLALADGTRLIVGACGHESSGIPADWAAREDAPGVDLLRDLSDETAAGLAARVTADKHRGDVAVVSIHWGDNWGYDVPHRHVEFAHRLVEQGIDVVHGHSSHHVRPIEVYRQKLILYGCGDFINDYEGIAGNERYRDDLVLMFFPSIDSATGRLMALQIFPLQIRKLRLNRPSSEDARWVCDTLNRINGSFGVRVELTSDRMLTMAWP